MSLNYELTLHKPFTDYRLMVLSWRDLPKIALKVNWLWWLIRIPMALIAASAAYGVSQFAKEYLPYPWHILAGWAFESTIIGAIALADQQVEEERATFRIGFVSFGYNPTSLLWYIVNISAVVASVLSNLLFFTGGLYAHTTWETLTHAVPLPVLGFFYGLLVHRASYQQNARNRKYSLEFPYKCRCGERFRSQKALNGHKAQCQLNTRQP